MKKTLSLAIVLSALATGIGMSAVILPTYVSGSSSPDSFDVATPAKLLDNSGLSANVPDGDTLSHALSVTHSYNGGWTESWVTNSSGNGTDYFASESNPIIVFDLGSDQEVGSAIIWQYQNNGGGSTNLGNNARLIDIRFNTEADGSTDFNDPPTEITVKNVTQLGGTNSAQLFSFPSKPTARYIQFEVTDNYYGQPDITTGGDRVGLGEVRFATEVPEPAAPALLGALALLGFLVRRR